MYQCTRAAWSNCILVKFALQIYAYWIVRMWLFDHKFKDLFIIIEHLCLPQFDFILKLASFDSQCEFHMDNDIIQELKIE